MRFCPTRFYGVSTYALVRYFARYFAVFDHIAQAS